MDWRALRVLMYEILAEVNIPFVIMGVTDTQTGCLDTDTLVYLF